MKKDIDISEKYIRWLSSLSKKDIPIAGGKGANLAEMYNANFPVPPAFIITAQSFDKFLREANLKEKIKKIISDTNVFNTKQLEENSKQIRELVIKAEIPEDMQAEIIEAYSILCTDKKEKLSNSRRFSRCKFCRTAGNLYKYKRQEIFN
jgi:pyruvate,water dikinase